MKRHFPSTWSAYAWAAPMSAAGVLLGLAARAGGAQWTRVDGVLEVAGGPLLRWVGRLPTACRFEAITIGHVVLALDATRMEAWRAHERVHVAQYARWGLLFPVAYGASSVWQALRGRHPYRDNRFERAAFAAQAVVQVATGDGAARSPGRRS